jgi:hypothetical protein
MDDQDRGLRSELEPATKLAVNQLLCQPLVGNATGEQLAGNPVRRLVKPFDGPTQIRVLGLVRDNLNLDCKLHA